METTQIMYRKSIVGWFNLTLVETGATYNVEPCRFNEITGASSEAVVGCMEITGRQLVELLTDRWTQTVSKQVIEAVDVKVNGWVLVPRIDVELTPQEQARAEELLRNIAEIFEEDSE